MFPCLDNSFYFQIMSNESSSQTTTILYCLTARAISLQIYVNIAMNSLKLMHVNCNIPKLIHIRLHIIFEKTYYNHLIISIFQFCIQFCILTVWQCVAESGMAWQRKNPVVLATFVWQSRGQNAQSLKFKRTLI